MKVKNLGYILARLEKAGNMVDQTRETKLKQRTERCSVELRGSAKSGDNFLCIYLKLSITTHLVALRIYQHFTTFHNDTALSVQQCLKVL